VPSNLIPIAALTQSVENKLAWWRIENSKILEHIPLLLFPAFRPRRSVENRA